MKRRLPRSAVLAALMTWASVGWAERAAGQAIDLIRSDEPVAIIGGSDEREAHQLLYAESAVRLSDGRIVVGDVGSHELRFFDPLGEHLQTVGRHGEGPGEFDGPWSITRLSGDTVAAWSRAQRRLTLFSPDGEPSVVTISSLATLLNEFNRHIDVGMFVAFGGLPSSGDRVLIEARPAATQFYVVDGLHREPTAFGILDPGTEAWIEIGPFPRREYFADRGIGVALPFGRDFRVAVGGSVIFMGASEDPSIQVRSVETGELIGEIALPVDPRPVTSADIEEYRSNAPAPLAEWLEEVPWPSTFPIFSDLKVGGDGHLWVQMYPAPTDPAQEWWQYTENGELIGRASIDPGAEVMDIGTGYVLVRVHDELDREEIRLYELTPAQ